MRPAASLPVSASFAPGPANGPHDPYGDGAAEYRQQQIVAERAGDFTQHEPCETLQNRIVDRPERLEVDPADMDHFRGDLVVDLRRLHDRNDRSLVHDGSDRHTGGRERKWGQRCKFARTTALDLDLRADMWR